MGTMHVPLPDEPKHRVKQELEARLREALLGGPAEPMTREDWSELERKVWERQHQEHSEPQQQRFEEGLHGHHERFPA